MVIYLKLHQTRMGKILAACDANIVGKTFSEGEKYLDLGKYKGFYGDKKATLGEFLAALKGDFSSANLVGRNVIAAAEEAKVLEKEDIMYVQNVPYAQIYYM